MKPEGFESRNTLLDHYSSKPSDHAMQLLTLALIAVGLVAARPQSYVIVLVLPAVFAAALWAAEPRSTGAIFLTRSCMFQRVSARNWRRMRSQRCGMSRAWRAWGYTPPP
jgi:hypothetical protein